MGWKRRRCEERCGSRVIKEAGGEGGRGGERRGKSEQVKRKTEKRGEKREEDREEGECMVASSGVDSRLDSIRVDRLAEEASCLFIAVRCSCLVAYILPSTKISVAATVC